MRRVIISTAASMAAVAILATSALAWHVDTGKDQQTVHRTEPSVTARSVGPKGDPLHRFVVKVGRSRLVFGECTGWVEVPSQSWANGTILTVDGTGVSIGKGERAHLPAGSYVGRWSNSREVERFTIRCRAAVTPSVLPGPVEIGISFVHNKTERRTTHVYSVDEGCTLRTGWLPIDQRTRFWAQDRTHGDRLLTGRAARDGYYGVPYRGYRRGVTC